MIMRKRTDFEHRINSRGSKPRDFLRYAEYEINVENLRKKRVARLIGKADSIKKSISDWAGPRRIMFIFDRGSRKFVGDIPFWLQYLQYAKQKESVKVISKIFTSLLQYHPTKPKVWLMAAKYEMDHNASMKAARSIMQRGLRFNQDSTLLWLEYAKLELLYVSKILTRRKLLGIMKDENEQLDEQGEGHVQLPAMDSQDLINNDLKTLPEADMSMLGTPETNPALKGDVALAIYDAATESMMKREHTSNQESIIQLSEQFLELFDLFGDLDRHYLCRHITTYLINKYSTNSEVGLLDACLSIRHSSHDSPHFPDLLNLVVIKYAKLLKSCEKSEQLKIKQLFREKFAAKYLDGELVPPLDDNIRKVLESLTR